ncbi:NAD(P)/FAD-dependent oxidoreductase [Colwellia psychrerythraea]|uniref:FAD dependent oxidoreductase n=1 Tax=Colwellia psychrerythraea TaxID=28229 RepID=A0A099KQ40_COLPS|nr:NAD(P)/FAD-dependent oxidoreductase [Colwellia psychrerythraea]KGJ92889.1 FAD dependent oxidoreductase [Colwellia psychrerythraea]
MDNVDVLIVGAGVIGLAITAKLSQQFDDVLVIDKNSSFGEETSSRNSEVIHAGIYYPQNSLKAKLCVRGKKMLYHYCQERHIPVNKIGKLLVAHGKQEEAFLKQTIISAKNNGVDDLTWLDQATLAKLEPDLRASAALHSPSTGIIDSHAYMQSLLAQAEQNDAMFVAQTKMISATPKQGGFEVSLDSQGELLTIQCKYLINCAGLHSVALAHTINGMDKSVIPELHWCRGHYFSYQGKSPFKQLIYPIPRDNGLGIHASLDMGGQLKFGPDTQYIEHLDYNFPEQLKDKFIKQISQYFPTLSADKLQPSYAGIRPKLQAADDPFKDFVIQTSEIHHLNGLVNLFGIDSPGLTSSLAIADYVFQKLKFV